jgi:phospholipase/carboxylesterase
VTSRRDFIRRAPFGVAALAAACKSELIVKAPPSEFTISARTVAPTSSVAPGVTPLGLASAIGRDGFIYAPASYSPAKRHPLLVMLHGGGGRSSSELHTPGWFQILDEFGALMLAPDSRSPFSWDLVDEGRYGPDVQFIDSALRRVFQRCNVDPARIALAGFSDGATEALGLGLMNGDLFRAVGGFSPGYFQAEYVQGHPSVFISHGMSDPVLPFTSTKTSIVPAIRALGVPVEFVEFEGGHTITVAVARQALTNVLGPA